MKGGSSKPPQAPDPYAVAGAQTQQNQDSAAYNAAINRTNTYTPYGSQEYSVTGTDPRTGAPIYRQDINLSPEQQELYEQRSGQALDLGNRNPFSLSGLPERGQLDTSNLPELPGSGDLQGFRDRSEQALYDRNTQYLDRDFGRREEGLRTRLANQGVVEGSEAYTNAFDDFERGREQSYSGARNDAIAGGGAEASRMFGIGSQTRGQMYGEALAGGTFQNQNRNTALAEALTERNQPVNEYNALQGAVNVPQFQGTSQVGAAPADIQGAFNTQYQGQLDAYNAQQQSRNSLMGGLFGLGASALSNPSTVLSLSDENAKENIEEIGELNDGTNIYLFNYKGQDTPSVGVMAQDVEKSQPDAVVTGNDGYKRVNYAKVMANALRAA